MNRLAHAAVLRAYAALLALYPRAFRDTCGGPMLEAFETVCRERAARMGPLRFVMAALPDLGDALRAARAARRRPHTSSHGASREGFLAATTQDAVHAFRRLRAQPGLVLFTVLTLGFGIAANAALFSIVDAVLLRPSPFRGAERLVTVLNVAPRGFVFPGLSREKLRHWRTERDVFEAVEGYRANPVVVTGGLEPQEIAAAQISPGLLQTLGVPPRLGRLFGEEDALAGQDRVALIGERLWRSHFGATSDAIGRTILIGGTVHRVVGVMPERFHFPTLRQQIWTPLNPSAAGPGGPITVVARLRDGLTVADAQQRLDLIAARLQREQPLPSGWGLRIHADPSANPPEETGRAVLVLFGAVSLVLLTAGANVAHMLLSRAVARRREFAIRLALGAGRGRLLRELAIEGLALGALAAVAGVAAARWSLDALVRLAPPDLTVVTTTPIAVDGRVMLFGLGLALVTGLLCNLPPALRIAQSRGAEALSGRGGSGTPLQGRFQSGLVVLEVTLSVMLLTGAALMARSFATLNAVDVGFEPDGLLAVSLGVDTRKYDGDAAQAALLERVAAALAGRPGVRGVTLATGMPPDPGAMTFGSPESESGPCVAEPVSVVANLVGPSYFDVLRVPIIEGRALRADDPADSVVISRTLATQCGISAGRRVRLGPTAPWLSVTGVAADVRTLGLRKVGQLAIYSGLPHGPFMLPNLATRAGDGRYVSRRIIVRSDQPAALVPDVKQALWSVDAAVPVLDARSAAELMAETVRAERFVLTLMSLFSTVALALASAGVFGVLAYAVAQRTREIGIRVALGAAPRNVAGLVVGQAARLAAAGIALGLAGAFVLSRLLAGLLHGVDPHDPAAFLSIAALVLTVALAASWIPASRAFRIDPAVALRDD